MKRPKLQTFTHEDIEVPSHLLDGGLAASCRGDAAGHGATRGRRYRGSRPNVLEIMLDDARSDLWTVMPKTAAVLLADGKNFVNNVTPDPDCCPARAATPMSGQYPHNDGVRTEADAFLLDQSHTIQGYLSQGGLFMTALSGKFLVSCGQDAPPANFNRYTFIKGGYYGYTALVGTKQGVATSVYKGTDASSYSTNFLTSQMQKYIDEFATKYSTKPWYGLLAFQARISAHGIQRPSNTGGQVRHRACSRVC